MSNRANNYRQHNKEIIFLKLYIVQSLSLKAQKENHSNTYGTKNLYYDLEFIWVTRQITTRQIAQHNTTHYK